MIIFATISLELLARLEPFLPAMPPMGLLRWQNYRIGGLAQPLAMVFKGPLGQPLTTDTVYRVSVYYRRGGRGGWDRSERPTLDHPEVRMKPAPEGSAATVLYWVECGKNEDVTFTGDKPLEVVRTAGRERKGFLYFAPVGGNTIPVAEREIRQVYFSGPVSVRLTGKPKLLQGAVKLLVQMSSGQTVEVYDRRKNWTARLASAEHVRVTVGSRSYEFWTLRDFAGDEVHHALTNDGLIAWEKETAK